MGGWVIITFGGADGDLVGGPQMNIPPTYFLLCEIINVKIEMF